MHKVLFVRMVAVLRNGGDIMAIRQTYVRMPEELHKKLRHEAAEYDVSLNQCIITLLAEALEARRVSAPNAQHKL